MIFSSKQVEIASYYFVAFSQTQAFLGDLNENEQCSLSKE
jgi:hypothetical protein